MQNLGRFYTTSDFDRQYLRNDSRYRKYGKPIDRERFHPRSAKHVRWTLVHYPESLTFEFGPTQIAFSGDYISADRGCWPLKFLNALDTGQGLLAHATNRVGGPKNFKREHLKLGWKFHICAAITLGVVGVTSRNFTTGCRSGPSSTSSLIKQIDIMKSYNTVQY